MKLSDFWPYRLVTSMLRLTRLPNLIIIAITQYFVAIFLVHDNSLWFEVASNLFFLLLVISTSMIAGAGYIINDYYDTKIDYVNRPKSVVVGRLIDRRYVLFIYFSLNGLSTMVGFLISLEIGFIHAVSIFLLWIHSNQMKRLPLMGNFTIGVLSGLSIALVAIFFNQQNWLVFTYAFFAFMINFVREILKDLEAIKGEEKFGSLALPSIWGIRNTKKLIYILITVSFLALSLFLVNADNTVASTYFILLIPLFIYFIFLLVKADTQQRFAFLGDFANFIMLSGIISITFF